jgi:hypothetical protein
MEVSNIFIAASISGDVVTKKYGEKVQVQCASNSVSKCSPLPYAPRINVVTLSSQLLIDS